MDDVVHDDYLTTNFFRLIQITYYLKLCGRGYTESKLSNNIECEIFQVLLEEAKESYPEDRVIALRSDTVEDMNINIATLTEWVGNWHP